MKKIQIIVFILLMFCMSCSKGIFLNFDKHPRGGNPYDPMGPADPKDEQAGTWLFMVYLDADNNLESAGIQDLNEMTEGAQGAEDIEIIVLIDRAEGFDAGDGNWKGTRLYRINKNGKTRLADAGQGLSSSGDSDELNMGDGATLQKFINYCLSTYTAEKYLLDIWNHGGGWRSPEEEKKLYNITKPICWDDSEPIGGQHDTLFMDEVQQAIISALSANGLSKLDIIYMDACLMQMVEVAYELQYQCNYLIASEETVPGNGGDYVDILARYKTSQSQGKHTPYRFSYDIISSYRNQYYSQGDTTLSAIDISKFQALFDALNTFAENVKNVNPSTLKTIRNKTKNFAYVDQADLYHFAELCNKDISGGVTGASDVMSAINNLMVKEYHHSSLPDCHGIAIYFPKNPSDTDAFYWLNGSVTLYDGGVHNLDFDDVDNKWVEFIQWWKNQ